LRSAGAAFQNKLYYPNLFGKVNRKFPGLRPARLAARPNLNHPDVIKLMILEQKTARVVGENDEG
jgi:hypothetical protein